MLFIHLLSANRSLPISLSARAEQCLCTLSVTSNFGFRGPLEKRSWKERV